LVGGGADRGMAELIAYAMRAITPDFLIARGRPDP
jgi:hypothetical protein